MRLPLISIAGLLMAAVIASADPPPPAPVLPPLTVPDVFVPGAPPTTPTPTPVVLTDYTVPLGTFWPLYVNNPQSAVKLSNPSIFTTKTIRLPKGGIHSGLLFTGKEPDLFTMEYPGFVYTAKKPGITSVWVWGNGKDGPLELFNATVIVPDPTPIEPAPAPKPDAPPLPPKPDTPPGPIVPPAPVIYDQLVVLVVFDKKTLTALPAAQQQAIYSADIRSFLDKKCPLGPDGKTHLWRMWPDGEDVSAGPPELQAAYRVKRDSLPWLVILNKKATDKPLLSAPLPATAAEFKTTLIKLGGA